MTKSDLFRFALELPIEDQLDLAQTRNQKGRNRLGTPGEVRETFLDEIATGQCSQIHA